MNATVTKQAIYAAGVERSEFVILSGVVARGSTTSELASSVNSRWCWPISAFVVRAEFVVWLAGDAVGSVGFGPPPVATRRGQSVRWSRAQLGPGNSGADVVSLGIGAQVTRVAPGVFANRDRIAGSISVFPKSGLALLEQAIGPRKLITVGGRRAE